MQHIRTPSYRRLFVAAVGVVVVLLIGALLLVVLDSGESPPIRPAEAPRATGTGSSSAAAQVGRGVSQDLDPEIAVNEALDGALGGRTNTTPDFLVVFCSEKMDVAAVVGRIRNRVGNRTQIFGTTSQSYAAEGSPAQSPFPSLHLLAVSSGAIRLGVASADYAEFPSPREAAHDATLRALLAADRPSAEAPRVILAAFAGGNEEDAIAGIEKAVGRNVPMLGGTAKGSSQSVIGNSVVSGRGVSVALLYTSLPVGWTFEAGYDVTVPASGVVTKVAGNELVEIDHRPAWEVYDEWLNGQLTQLADKGPAAIEEVYELMGLNPFYRQYKTPAGQIHLLFTHPLPLDRKLQRRGIRVGIPLRVGDRIHLSHGSWEVLLNRIGGLPRVAKLRGGLEADETPLLGIGYVCAGVMSVIPRAEKAMAPRLMSYAMNGAPFVYMFSGGEQGFFPGLGNKHANLSTSFLVIGAPRNKSSAQP